MSLFKRRRKQDADIKAAKRAADGAKARRVQVSRDWPEVMAAGEGLRREVERNHMYDLFAKTLGGQS